MTSQPIILSIIIISHNQKNELKRCVDSVLAQNIPFEYEIILSDDRSDDGTFELAKEYEIRFPNIIKASQCNSDVCNPANNSQRSGWNRCNGYKLATGKYIAHVDADDYFIDGSQIYQRQVEMLEKHPECSLCMENIVELNETDPIEKGRNWFQDENVVKEERIIDAATFIKNDYFILNQAFIQRRNPNIDPTLLYGKRYVDAVITYHHLQFGPIVCVNACDYVYVKYQKSISGNITKNDDGWVVYCLGIYIPRLIPCWRNYYYLAKLSHIFKVVGLALKSYKLSDTNYKYLKELNIYIFSAFNRRLSIFDYIRLIILRLYIWIMIKCHITSKSFVSILHILLVK